MTIPSYNVLQVRNDLDVATISMVGSLRRAGTLSQVGSGDSVWGVYTATGSILIYKGASYSSRDANYDETTTISPTIVISGLNDISFSKMYGIPNKTGTTTFTSIRNQIRNVTINQKGVVDY
jgi:hypothetical protein